ncbi:MAG: DNA-processing protein DprA [Oscillospiraceae bacterium]|jgi:predicted Rossmann fold nucleotide-binding protein DprA/Smf involved in DNA uptake|nr:DNA-processing protein DprA [Oscillospiraceae bacterium]
MLLLCCALGDGVAPLTAAQYRILAQRVAAAPQGRREELDAQFLVSIGYSAREAAHILALLARSAQSYLASAAQRGCYALSRISEQFPKRLRERLGDDCPPALFYSGDVSLLQKPCVALVGARDLRPENGRFASQIGALAAKEGYVLVSGGARGADSMAQQACLRAGGSVICFVSDELYRHKQQARMLYCSEEGFDYAFSTPRALRRNRLIHALGAKTFVAQSALEKGGTWRGTWENLQRGYSPVYVFNDNSEAAIALIERGAQSVPIAPQSLGDLPKTQLSIFDDCL